MGFYELSAKSMGQEEISMRTYEGQVVLVVNTASKCGFTGQFTSLETLYQDYKERGFQVLGFPCNQFANQDPKSNEEIASFCKLNFGVTFPLFQKVDVNGKNTHPVFAFLKNETGSLWGKTIKWNFTKFLVDSKGNVVKRYAPTVSPLKLREDIEKLLP